MEVKEGSTWDDLLKTIGLTDIDKNSKQFVELQDKIESNIKTRLTGKETPQRYPSVTRNRSESDQDTEEQKAKKAKAAEKSPEKEEEAKAKPSPTVPKPSPQGRTKNKNKNKNGGF